MLYSGYVLFNAISLIHVLRSDTFKAERILIGHFEHNSLERLAAASGCMSSYLNPKFELPTLNSFSVKIIFMTHDRARF